ncbi:MAG TPA: signal recognition particle-docking protein FtsY [Candidatus Nitrosocosmicus sp.]|nr:signal recognition particle-docking protein FtsY [Candidatus Nitrosocosmicus sp.]
MFDKLKKAFSNAAKSIGQKELSEKDLDESLFDLNVSLLESDVSQEVVDDLSKQLKQKLVGIKLQKDESAEQILSDTLKNSFSSILSQAGSINLIQEIKSKKQNKAGPFKIVFLGINGTGKTTTVAKVANLIKKAGFSVVIAAADTHRAGAIEQISSHAEKLSIKVISQRYGADPSAVARDALEYARKHYIDVVLIDTAGRMQTAKNLMDEIGKIVKVIKPDLKLFVGDSLSGNDTINQAKEFFSYTEFDGAILTKADADAKGGSVISISYITSKPVIYLGVGQGYDDIITFNKNKFVETIFANESLVSSQKNVQEFVNTEPNVNSSDSVYYPKEISYDQSQDDLSIGDNVFEEKTPLEQSTSVSSTSLDNADKIINEVKLDPSDTDASTGTLTSNAKATSDESNPETRNTLSISENIENEIDLPHETEKNKNEKKSRFGWFKKKK